MVGAGTGELDALQGLQEDKRRQRLLWKGKETGHSSLGNRSTACRATSMGRISSFSLTSRLKIRALDPSVLSLNESLGFDEIICGCRISQENAGSRGPG